MLSHFLRSWGFIAQKLQNTVCTFVINVPKNMGRNTGKYRADFWFNLFRFGEKLSLCLTRKGVEFISDT